MYLGVVHVSLSRKEHECVSCKEPIKVGEWKFLVVRKFKRKDGRNGINSRYVHLDCFPHYSLFVQRRRETYLRESGRIGTGRPHGSELRELERDDPEKATERKHLLQRRSRLHKKLLVCEEYEEGKEILRGLRTIEKRIREILPLMVQGPGRRSRETAAILKEKEEGWVVRLARKEKEKEPRPFVAEPQPDPSRKTPEELEQIKKEIFERSEAYQESGQLWTEDGRD